MVVTSDQKRVQKLKILRSHGAQPKYFHTYIGGNFRLDALQATIVRTKLQFLDNWIEQRQKRAHIYNRLLHSIPMVQMPHTRMQRHTFNSYIVQVPKRNALMAFLTERGIQTQIYYPLPLHLQQCFSSLRHKKGDFPVSEKAAQETLALPIYPELTNQQQEYVVCCIREFYQVSPVPGRSLSAVQHCSCCNKQR
jgi:dTDP-4-amino-4,6-dideoxygalactose transaminase